MKKLQVTTTPSGFAVHPFNKLKGNVLVMLLLFSFLLSPFSFLLFAQRCASPSSGCENKKIFFGVSIGPTIDWFTSTSKDLARKNVKGGMITGINLDINLSKSNAFYFSTGVLVRYLQGDFSYKKEYDFSGISLVDSLIQRPTVTTYQTTYLTIPTGLKFRTSPSKNCVFVGKLGLYHNIRIGGKQYDSFTLPNFDANPNEYYVSTPKIPNDAAARFAESAYIGLGFEYSLKNNFRVFTNVDYSCQFNYFSSKAKNNITDKQFKSIVHSLHIVVGILF